MRERAARRYVAGPALEDAVAVGRRCQAAGLGVTLSCWSPEERGPAGVAAAYLAAVEAMRAWPGDRYLSVKAPDLAFDSLLLDTVVDRAATARVAVHFDALAPEAADSTFGAMARAAGARTEARLGCTLPGRWRRSGPDAERAIRHGWRVRLVKGQWPDPEDAAADPRRGVLALAERLAGRAREVAIATHDVRLALAARRRLVAAGTPCAFEVLFGVRAGRLARAARATGTPVRVYVPFGRPFLPYAFARRVADVGLLGRLLLDQLAPSLPLPAAGAPVARREGGAGGHHPP
jgi:proline dehydrogenase